MSMVIVWSYKYDAESIVVRIVGIVGIAGRERGITEPTAGR